MKVKEIEIQNKWYPKQLRKINNPPKKLYVLGNHEILNTDSLSIIGSRCCTSYGADMAREFARKLAKKGITIVSGMAKGIDSNAHLGAIEANGKTIAVLGSGFNHIYPDKEIYEKILKSGGAVITEYSENVGVSPQGFRDRNRIVAGLSLGTLVIEAKQRSGTGITANYVKRYKRKLFCIPHKIEDKSGVGTAHYNFDQLNTPLMHPSRDLQDTIYITDDILLRSQTSPVQARVMERQKPPIKIICPGAVYRADSVDATHSPVFHQIEGLAIDKNITMANLKGTLEAFTKMYLGENIKIRFRPHHFPFTEPSAEADVSCFVCGGKGCRVCKQEGWIEIVGCGMVHPNVLRNCGIDPKEYSGFAFGFGVERIAMAKYGIEDLRLLYENDVRLLKQF